MTRYSTRYCKPGVPKLDKTPLVARLAHELRCSPPRCIWISERDFSCVHCQSKAARNDHNHFLLNSQLRRPRYMLYSADSQSRRIKSASARHILMKSEVAFGKSKDVISGMRTYARARAPHLERTPAHPRSTANSNSN